MDENERQDRDATAVVGERWSLAGGTRRPVPELVEERVVELVAGGQLSVGDRLPTEPELARRFGVARSSVRTALQRLQARGVLQVNRGRGWFVASDSRSSDEQAGFWAPGADVDLLEVMQVRIALEGMAAALAAVRRTDGDLDEIAKLNQAHRDARLDDPAELLRTDQEFHAAIVASAANDYLRGLYGSVTPLLASWRATSFDSPQVLRRSATDHEQILWQLRRGDEMGARLAMTSHLLGQHDAIAATRGDAFASRARATLGTFIDDDAR